MSFKPQPVYGGQHCRHASKVRHVYLLSTARGTDLKPLMLHVLYNVAFLPTCFAYINWVPLAVTVVKIREPPNPAVNSMRVWSASELHAHSCFLYRVDMYFRLLDTDFCLHAKQIKNVFNWMVDYIFNMQYIHVLLYLLKVSENHYTPKLHDINFCLYANHYLLDDSIRIYSTWSTWISLSGSFLKMRMRISIQTEFTCSFSNAISNQRGNTNQKY